MKKTMTEAEKYLKENGLFIHDFIKDKKFPGNHFYIRDLLEDYANRKIKNLPISDVSDWVAAIKTTPEFDGNYLCYINQPQECGNIWRYYKTVYLEHGKWVLQEGEQVIFWTNKAFPFHISPEPPCR
jgi:hypothetical protein